MARSLEELQKQYNSGSKHESLRGGPGSGHGPGGPRGRLGGKPKNLKKTVKRILSYLKEYRLRLALVFLCMFFLLLKSEPLQLSFYLNLYQS